MQTPADILIIMATAVQIRETEELAKRSDLHGPHEALNSKALFENTAFLEPAEILKDTALFEGIEAIEPQPERQPVTTNDLDSNTRRIHTLLRALASILIAPFLLAAALVIFLFALADFAWFRLRDLRNGQSHPKGLWEF